MESGETLEDVVRNTLIHEIGHHFGLSDEDMERLESGQA
jgi:predicted Zn-dependent protease with MMP-like domain